MEDSKMQVYQLTEDERSVISSVKGAPNTILVVCDLGGDVGCVVDYDALVSEQYSEYLAAIAPLDPDRIVDIETPL